jgi:ketosteroid isomerase-like protein
MADIEELGVAVDRIHLALDAFFNGDAEPARAAYSRAGDVSLANPFGPPVVGWDAVSAAMQQAAAHYRDGRATGFDRIGGYESAELAYTVELEHYVAKVGESERESPVTLRVTTILRLEEGAWRIVHRHADPITTTRGPETVVGSSG